MVKKKKVLDKKINNFIKKTYYGRTPQDPGYLKSEEGIGSLEDIYNPPEQKFLETLNKNLPENLRSYITFEEYAPGKGRADVSIIDKKTGKKIHLDLKSSASDTRKIRNALEQAFGNFEKGLEALKKYEPQDEVSKAIKKIRDNSEPLSTALEKIRNKISVTNPHTGAVRKQKFKTDIITPLAPQVLGRDYSEDAYEYFKEFFKEEEKLLSYKDAVSFMERLSSTPKKPNVLKEYMEKHESKSVFDVIKKHGKEKKLMQIKSWEDLSLIGRSLNFTPQELFDYGIEKAQTKKKFMELAFYREIDKNNNQAFFEFIPIYKKHLETKKPLKLFMFTDEYKLWSAKWDFYFKSEENLRQNIKMMIKIWNKQFPKDKIPEKLK